MDTERRIDGFLAKFSPAIEAELRAARQRLRGCFPRGVEMVFDNYNALVFAFGPTDKATAAFVSIAGYPRWVTLFFLHGGALDDPDGLLEGDGKQVRSVRLKSADDLAATAIRRLIDQAIAPHRPALDAAPSLTTIVKMVVAKQRPRRPATKPATRRDAG